MTDPRRLLEDDDERFELRLLRSARKDRVPEGAFVRTALALGLTAGGATGVSAAYGATAARLTTGTLLKWFGAGILGGVVVTGSLDYAANRAGHRSTPALAPAAGVGKQAEGAPKGTSQPEPAPTPIPTSSAEAEPPVIPTEPNAAAARTPRPRLAASASEPSETAEAPRNRSLAGELAILETARAALLAHDPALVLRELDVYGRTPRSGVLDAEAAILRVEAWLQQGDRTRAAVLAREVLSANPSSPHAARLRKILDGN